MKILKTVDNFKSYRRSLQTESVGFVPTMGALHKGHSKLIEHSLKENKVTIVSIFVNPTQFNDSKDYEGYPSTLDKDLGLCESLGVSAVFLPDADEMYQADESIVIFENDISKKFEGELRPGHFSGVLRVLLKLLNIVRPDFIYMGEKDYQQALLTQKLCKEYFLDTVVRVVKTVRDESGLPFSSRNLKLSVKGLKEAQNIAERFHSTENKEDFLKNLVVELDYYGSLENKILMAHRIEGIRILDNKDVK